MTTIRAKRVRTARIGRGLGQSELAKQAGISRQALSAIEAGSYQPGVAVALRLAQALNQSVESLFGEERCDQLRATVAGGIELRGGSRPIPVALARVGGRVIAVPRPPVSLTLTPAAGAIERGPGRERAGVTAFGSAAEIDSTILLAGCDPAATLLADRLARKIPATNLVAVPRSSREALAALRAGKMHIAGVHLRDSVSGEYNLKAAREALGKRRCVLVNFARWELGLATHHGNRLGIRSVADLVRPGIRLINRERGSGARLALDEGLADRRIPHFRINGYEKEVSGHLEVAAAIALGQADVGITVRVAAEAYELAFVSMREERYDLVIPECELESAQMRAMLEALNSSRLARQLSQLCAYDTTEMGKVVARF